MMTTLSTIRATHPRMASAATAAALVLALSGCGTPGTSPAPVYGPEYAYSTCTNCGVIESIALEQHQPDNSLGVGTVIGGVAGALLGNQIGHGRGNNAATIVGAAGGAYAGHQLEKKPGQMLYRIAVRLDNGTRADVLQGYDPRLPVGAAVRIVGDHVEPR